MNWSTLKKKHKMSFGPVEQNYIDVKCASRKLEPQHVITELNDVTHSLFITLKDELNASIPG